MCRCAVKVVCNPPLGDVVLLARRCSYFGDTSPLLSLHKRDVNQTFRSLTVKVSKKPLFNVMISGFGVVSSKSGIDKSA